MVDQPPEAPGSESSYEGGAPSDAVVMTPEQRQAIQQAAAEAGIIQAPQMAGNVVAVPPPSDETRPDPVPPPELAANAAANMVAAATAPRTNTATAPQPAQISTNVVHLPRPDLDPNHAANKIVETIGDDDEFIRWLTNGKIQVRLLVDSPDGPIPREWTFRRPKVKHLKHLREFYEELAGQEQMAALARTDTMRARQRLVNDEGKTFVEAAEMIPLPDQPQENVLKWIEEVFATLADHPLGIERDELPAWFDNTEHVTKFFERWRNLPLALGT